MKPFSIQIDEAGDTVTIEFGGELDIATTAGADSELRRVEQGGARVIVLDLRGLTFMDSTGLRLLVSADARARGGEHRLAIVRGPAAVQRVLELTGLDARLDVIDDPAEARADRPTG
ncbi:MAG TPA: STAS domain-containing protein [Solirubrobacteraceae bacterium]|nr:STAS domain-containing protein [Solirubrobacteraceae bacterium]